MYKQLQYINSTIPFTTASKIFKYFGMTNKISMRLLQKKTTYKTLLKVIQDDLNK